MRCIAEWMCKTASPLEATNVARIDSMAVMIGPLPKASIRGASRLLARAFAADPVITHFLDGATRRRVAFPAFFRTVIFESLDSGHVFGAWEGDGLVGVAVWIPPRAAVPT